YEKQKKSEEAELAEIAAAERQSNLNKFMKLEKNIVSSTSKDDSSTSSISNMVNGKNKKLPSFWVPSETPSSKKIKISKPDTTVTCPLSGKPLRMKDLIDVKWTEVKDPDEASTHLITRKARYKCAVTHDILSDAVPCAVIRTTGDVVTMECVEKIIKKDWIHPLTNEKLTEKDIIPMQRGGTGYATTNDNLTGEYKQPVLQA
ncbi:nitric oxide synthase-interacting protein homolog, partial [Ctenocephalides felis]